MGIGIVSYPKIPKVSDLDVDADLDMAGFDLKVDDIVESTGAAGVTIPDAHITADVIAEKTAGAGITLDGQKLKDNQVLARTIAPSNDVLDSEDAVVQITVGYTVYTGYLSVTIPNYVRSGKVRLSADIKPDYAGNTAYIKWMLNGVISLGGAQTFAYVDATTYGTKTEDIIVKAGDVLEWYMKTDANYFSYRNIRVLGVVSQMTVGAWNLT